jgi:hypothetical protein
MKKKHFAGLAIGALMVALVAFMLPTAQAADGTIEANVTLYTGLSVTQAQALAFGVIIVPTTGCNQWYLDPTNGAMPQTGAGDGGDPFPMDHSAGAFKITGNMNTAVTYSITDFTDANITLTVVNADLNPLVGTTLDGSGEANVDVGGTLEVCAGAAAGLHSDALVELTANY